MEKTKPITYIAFVSAMLLWSFSFIWSKQAFETYDEFTVLAFRLSLAAISLFLISKIFGLLQKIKKEDWILIFLLSFFEPILYFVGENKGLQLVSPTIAAVMISTIPLGMPFIAKYFFKEKITFFNLFGLSISVTGVMLIIFEKGFVMEANPKGIAYLLLAVFSALGYTVILKRVTPKYNAFTIVTWQNIIAAVVFICCFFTFEFTSFMAIGIDMEAMFYIFLLALVASNGAFLLYTYGLKNLGVAKAGVFTNLIPIFTAIISLIVFKEHLNPIKYIGIGVVVFGLMISQISRKKK